MTAASPLDLTAPATDSSLDSVTACSESSSAGLTFTRSVRRTARQIDSSSDSEDGSIPAVRFEPPKTAAAAEQAATARRLDFAAAAAPGTGNASSTLGTAARTSSGAVGRATVHWEADVHQTLDTLTDCLVNLELSPGATDSQPDSLTAAAAAAAPPEQPSHSPAPGSTNLAGDESPVIIWSMAKTPRRRRAVLSDSDAEDANTEQHGTRRIPTPTAPAASAVLVDAATPAAATTSATPADVSVGGSAAVTPWRCTPPWLATLPRAQPLQTPVALSGSRRTQPSPTAVAATPARGSNGGSSSGGSTPKWMSQYKPPPPPEVAASRRNLSSARDMAAGAVPRRRQQTVRLPPEIITVSSDDEGLPSSSRAAVSEKENRSPASTGSTGFRIAWPSLPKGYITPTPIARPTGTGRKGPPVPFARIREQRSKELYREFNARVFDNKMPHDLQITWSNTLLRTAGLTHYSMQNSWNMFGGPKYCARIELSAKVLDRDSRLHLTLAHELCHAAAWIFDHVAKPPHGQVYPNMEITRCHNYEIFYAFKWQCTNPGCNQTYGRHSNSLDVTKKVCGRCRAPLMSLGKFNADGTPAKARAASAYSLFVKENYAAAKAAAAPKTPHKDIMKQLSTQWNASKQ